MASAFNFILKTSLTAATVTQGSEASRTPAVTSSSPTTCRRSAARARRRRRPWTSRRWWIGATWSAWVWFRPSTEIARRSGSTPPRWCSWTTGRSWSRGNLIFKCFVQASKWKTSGAQFNSFQMAVFIVSFICMIVDDKKEEIIVLLSSQWISALSYMFE